MSSNRAEVSGQGHDGRPGRRGQPAADVARHRRRPLAGGAAWTSPRRTCAAPRCRCTSPAPLVEGNYPFGPLAGTAFNLTTMSYAGALGMGLFVDPVAVDDPAGLRDHVEAAYEELIAAGSG